MGVVNYIVYHNGIRIQRPEYKIMHNHQKEP